MKKTFTKLFAALSLLVFMTPSLVGWGQTKGSPVTYTFSDHYNSNTTLDGVKIALGDGITALFNKRTGGTATQYYTNGDAVRWYGGGTLIIDASGNSSITTITQIKITFTQTANSVSVNGGSYSLNNSVGTWTKPNDTNITAVTFTQSGTAGHCRISAIEVSYTASGGGQQLIATTTSITAPQTFNTDVYTSTTAGTLTAAVTYDDNGTTTNVPNATVTWASTNTSVATVDADGNVTLVAAGTTDITATYAGDNTYDGSYDTYQLTVTSSAPAADVTFTAGTDTGSTTSNNSPDSMTKGGVTVSSTDAAFATTEYRLYQGSTTTISAPGYTITSIVFTGADTGKPVSNLSVNNNNGTYSVSNNNVGTWTGSASSISFNASAQARVSKIEIWMTANNTPTISANPSTLNTFSYLSTSTDPSAAQSVAVTGANLTDDITASVGANSVFEISTAENGTYTNSLTLDESNGEVSTTIWVRMKANQTGNPTGTLTLSSTNASVTIDLNGSVVTPMSVADAIDAIDNASNNQVSGAYVLGIISEVVSYQSNYNSITYWISDDGESNELQVYSGLGLNGAPFSALTDLSVGDEVVVYGDLKIHNNVYEFNYNSQIVSLTPHQAQDYTLEVTSVSNAEIIVFDATDPDETNWVNLFDGVDEAEVTEGTPIALSVSAVEGYALSELMVNGDNHVADIDGGVYTFNMPAQSVTITVTAVPVYNITYSENGVETQAQVLSTTLTLPTADDLDSEFAFAGWTTTPGNFVTPTAAGTQVNIQGGETFYAVYARIEGREAYYEKVTENLQDWSGNYLIVAVGEYADHTAYSVAFDGSLETLDAANNNIDVKIENNRIDYDESNAGSIFTIAPIYNNNNEITGWSIKSASGYYIGRTANSNGMNVNDQTVYSHEIEIDENAVITASGGTTLRYNKASDQKRFRYYKDYGQQPIQLYKEVVVSLGTTSYYTRVFLNETATASIDIDGPSIIPSGSILNMGGNALTNNTAANLIIEDGGQLVTTSSNVQATFKKTIATSTNNDAHWYTISSPVTNTVAPADPGVNIISVYNLVNNDVYYNLYRYDEESYQWEAYNPTEGHHTDFTALLNGHGYLYRNNGQPLTFTGEVNVEDVEVPVTAASSNNGIKGFNLLGNPYSHDITLKHVKTDKNEYFYNCYILSGEGSWTAGTLYDDETSIHPCQGFFVQANEYAIATISKNTQRGINANGDFIRFTVANNEYKDVAYAIFDKGQDLTKINHRNAKIQQIYIPKDDENFAIATMADNNQSFNLNFKAMTMGQYTLSFKAKGEFNYLHVIDRMTGEDIDMLLEGEYSFIGSPQDNEARFIVRLGYLPNYDNNGADIFAYQNGSNIIVSGEGELQIFDVMGRMVSTQNVNGTETISVNTQGVYVFRLVGTEIKTQKIVVR